MDTTLQEVLALAIVIAVVAVSIALAVRHRRAGRKPTCGACPSGKPSGCEALAVAEAVARRRHERAGRDV